MNRRTCRQTDSNYCMRKRNKEEQKKNKYTTSKIIDLYKGIQVIKYQIGKKGDTGEKKRITELRQLIEIRFMRKPQ